MGSTNANVRVPDAEQGSHLFERHFFPLTEAAIATGSCIGGIFGPNILPVGYDLDEVRERTRGLGVVFHVSVDVFLPECGRIPSR